MHQSPQTGASVKQKKENWLTKCEQELAVVIQMP